MAHLGYLLTALADGQLSAATTEKVLEHVAVCPACAAELAAERRARRLLADAECEAVPAGLAARLRTIGAEQQPEPAPHPRQHRALRAAAWAGLGSVVGASAFAGALFVLGSPRDTGPALNDTVALATLGQVADEPATTLTITTIETAPAVPFTVTGRRALADDGELVELSGRGGHVVVVVQPGRLDADSVAHLDPVPLAGAERFVLTTEPWHAVWQSGGDVVEIITDLPPQQVAELVAHFPAQDYDAAPTARIARGWSVLTGGWTR